MRTLYESILRPDDDIESAVELEPILKKYGWWYKSAIWEGKTLVISNPHERVYLNDFDKVMEELHCKSIRVWPWALISASGPIDGIEIEAGTRIDITAPKVTGCVLRCKQYVTIYQPKENIKPVYTHNDFQTRVLHMDGVDGITFAGNNFDNIEILKLERVGPKIEKIVMSWNFITNELQGGIWSTYPRPKGEPKLDLDPMKALGLNKHFKNINRFEISGGKRSGFPEHLEFVCPGNPAFNRYKDGYSDLRQGIKVKYLTSGWQLFIQK